MSFRIQNHLNFDAIHKAARTYTLSLYNQYTAAANKNSQAYSKLPVFFDFFWRHASSAFNSGKAFVWTHRQWIAGGTLIGAALLKIHHYWKNRPQYPVVKMASSLDVATLSIENPKEEPLPPNATLIFCIDTSGSMREEGRSDAVKKSLNEVLDSAQKVVDTSPGAHISIEIIGFKTDATVVTPVTQLVPSDPSVLQRVKEQIENLDFGGGTEILEGLGKAADDLKSIVETHRQGTRSIILLSDGEQQIGLNQLSGIHANLAPTEVRLFGIGIGARHNKVTMEQIVTSSTESFRGKYIDTTNGKDTIESAITAIYQQAISSFNELELTAPDLETGTWSVVNAVMTVVNGQTLCNLGVLPNGRTLEKVIKIHSHRLPNSIDLSKVTFQLAFRDPKGRQGKVFLPWKPNTIINPAIIRQSLRASKGP